LAVSLILVPIIILIVGMMMYGNSYGWRSTRASGVMMISKALD
jgi:hypothetical protein